VTRREGLQSLIDLVLVWVGANLAVVHDVTKAIASQWSASLEPWPADLQKVRAKTTNKPLDDDLKHRGGDQRIEQTKDSVVEVQEAPNANLHEKEYS
jgi:hypothetical protein